MDVKEINNIIAQAKNRYNSQKGQADGLLHDAQTLFVSTIASIIDSQLTEIAQLKAPKRDPMLADAVEKLADAVEKNSKKKK